MRPRVDFYPDSIAVILHFPALRHTQSAKEQELDFVVGRNFIITTRYDSIDPLHEFAKIFEVNALLERPSIGDHAGFFFFYMLKKLYRSIEHEVDYIRRDLQTIEERIYAGDEVDMVVAISRSARALLNIRQTIEPHREVLKTLEADGAKFFGDDFSPYLRTLAGEYYRVHNHVMRETESLHELRETNNSLLSTKQNETMKVLTIMAFVTFPLSLIASIFGMNTGYLPLVGRDGDFLMVMGIMGFAAMLMFLFFKHKKWL